MEQRIEKLKKALLHEREAELSRYEELLGNQPINERIKAGVTKYPVAYTDQRYNTFEDLVLIFELNSNQLDDSFSTNGKIELFSANSEERITGTIVKIKQEIIEVNFRDEDIPDWIKGGKLGLNILPDTRTIAVQLKTLERIEKGELPLAKAFYSQKNYHNFQIEALNLPAANASQNTAIANIASSNPFHIIHGPPGTGKTRTLVNAINELAAQNKKVMVAAPSNAAVDHITAEIAQKGLTVVRVGNTFKTKTEVLPYTLKHQILNSPLMDVLKRLKKESESIRKKAFKYKRNFDIDAYQERKRLKNELREIRKDIRNLENEVALSCLKSAQVITGTFIGLNSKKLSTINFDYVLVDEAGQALEPAVWSVAHYAPQLILAGDPLQLSPTLFSDEAVKLGLGKSLIEEGIKLNVPTTLLNVQYRMNAKIMQFSNAQFYKGLLTAHESVHDQTLKNEVHAAIEFIDTAGCGFDEALTEAGGIFNEGEIRIIAQRLAEFKAIPKSIGLISPYRKQVKELQQTFEQLASNCQTIDSFQGQERDLIILSLVRSNDTGTIGFLKDYRRMNVAMTRAKKKLIIIGDSATIGADSFYADFLDYTEKNGAYRSAWEFTL